MSLQGCLPAEHVKLLFNLILTIMKVKSFVLEMFENGITVVRQLSQDGKNPPEVVAAGQFTKVCEELEKL